VREPVDLSSVSGGVFNGSVWGGAIRAFAFLVREVGFPVVVCATLWFDLRPQLQQLVLTQQKILEVQSALAVRKCIPLGQEWIPSPQGYVGPGKHGCPLYERVDGVRRPHLSW
jgi:hypothetical protein